MKAPSKMAKSCVLIATCVMTGTYSSKREQKVYTTADTKQSIRLCLQPPKAHRDSFAISISDHVLDDAFRLLLTSDRFRHIVGATFL